MEGAAVYGVWQMAPSLFGDTYILNLVLSLACSEAVMGWGFVPPVGAGAGVWPHEQLTSSPDISTASSFLQHELYNSAWHRDLLLVLEHSLNISQGFEPNCFQ